MGMYVYRWIFLAVQDTIRDGHRIQEFGRGQSLIVSWDSFAFLSTLPQSAAQMCLETLAGIEPVVGKSWAGRYGDDPVPVPTKRGHRHRAATNQPWTYNQHDWPLPAVSGLAHPVCVSNDCANTARGIGFVASPAKSPCIKAPFCQTLHMCEPAAA